MPNQLTGLLERLQMNQLKATKLKKKAAESFIPSREVLSEMGDLQLETNNLLIAAIKQASGVQNG